jgi:integrase
MACKVKVNRHGYLAFRLYWNSMESWEGTEFKDTPENRKFVEAQAVIISREIKKSRFDYLQWFPNGNRAKLFTSESNRTAPKTIRQYYDDWKKDKTPPFVKKSRGRKYTSHFEGHILPLHGDKYLHLYSIADIREIRTHLVDFKKLSMKTAKNVVNATLRAFFRDAKAEGLIEKNPFADLPKRWWPRVVLPEPDPFTEQERDQILDYFFKKHWQKWPHGCAFLYTQFWAGPRPSESTARRWSNLDPKNGKLTINTSRTEGEEGATKTMASTRTIALLKPVLELLKQIKPLRAQPDDHIFLDQRGRPINHWKFGEQHFQGALTALNIRHRDFYNTRHTLYP